MNLEIWKVIKDFPDYEISNMGRVRSFKNYKQWKPNRILEPSKSSNGYLHVDLYINKKPYTRPIHRLVYENFHEKLKEDDYIHHFDENKENNYISNLEPMDKLKHNIFHNCGEKAPWLGRHHLEESKNLLSKTRKEKFRSGELNLNGENNPAHKLKEWKIKTIRQILNLSIIKQLKITQKEIAEVFGISESTISKIKVGRTWSHV